MDDKGLIIAYLLDEDGGGSKISWEEINSLSNDDMVWIHLDYTEDSAIKWIKNKSGLDEIIKNALLDEDTRPRSLIMNNGIFMSLRGVNLNPGQDPEDMVSIRIWLDSNRVISTRKRKLLAVDDIRSLIEHNKGPRRVQDFIAIINHLLSKRIMSVVDKILTKVDDLEEIFLSSTDPIKFITKISDLRKQVILIKRYLLPQKEALYDIYLNKSNLIDESL